MQCPKCKKHFDSGRKCPHCKVDIKLYARTSSLSDTLYNTGLARLGVSDLTHGIEALTRSIAMNKTNIQARNLLGLALFEVGHVGEAITHWVISTSITDGTDVINPAEAYLEQVNKNARSLEKLNDAITMYNNALGHIKNKSDDLAIIQLKKAVDNNPKFIDALNLLALCYLIQSQKDQAATIVGKVLALDPRNPVALNYYSVLYPGKAQPQPQASPGKAPVPALSSVGPYKGIHLQDKKSTNFHIGGILLFIAGAACALALGYFLLYPAFQREHESDLATMDRQAQQMAEAHQEALDARDADIAALEVEKAALESQITDLEGELELHERIGLIHQAYRLYQDNHLREAVDILANLDTTGIPFDIRHTIDVVNSGAYPRLATIYFNEGIAAFNGGDLYKALADLELAFYYMEPDGSPQWRELLFHLGSVYYRNGRLDDAYDMLAPLREGFPNHRPLDTGRMLTSIGNQR